MAKTGQMEAVKIMAKGTGERSSYVILTCVPLVCVDLVRTRSFVKKFILMRANIQAISLKIQTLRSQAAMANALKGETILARLLMRAYINIYIYNQHECTAVY